MSRTNRIAHCGKTSLGRLVVAGRSRLGLHAQCESASNVDAVDATFRLRVRLVEVDFRRRRARLAYLPRR
jgi:hypothetical protein